MRQVNASYLQKHHILEKWNKLTAPCLWNEGQHQENAKWDKLTLRTYKSITMGKWHKLTAWYLGNESQHEDNAKVRQVNTTIT